MKSYIIKMIFRVFCSAVLINMFLIMQAVALEIETHKAINSYIADENSAVYGSNLNSYLKNNLGMQNGVKSIFNSKMAKEWIIDGGEYEDDFGRYLNHFYNPFNNKGWGIFFSAKDWATTPIGNQYEDGKYS